MSWKELSFFGFLVLLWGSLAFVTVQRNKAIKISELAFDISPKSDGFLTQEIVNKLLIQSEDSLFTRQKDMVDLNKIEMFLRNNKVIRNAEIYGSPQGKLHVRVQERQALLRVYGKEEYYLDATAVRFPLSKIFTPEVPLFFGSPNKKEQKQLIDLVAHFNADKILGKELVHLRMEEQNVVLGLRSFSFDVVWGAFSQNTTKLEKLKRFCAYMQAHPDKSIDRIDLRFDRQVVAQHNEEIWKNKK